MSEGDDRLTPMAHAASNRCFGCGSANSTGLKLEFFRAPDGSVVASPTFSGAFDGHPGYLHGGIIATLLDEAMSKSVRALGKSAMTRKLEIEFLRPVPSNAPLRIEGRIVRSERRKHFTEGRILDTAQNSLAQATGLFIEISQEGNAGQKK
jgi:uncharacterized protein (TIGR00369 family)